MYKQKLLTDKLLDVFLNLFQDNCYEEINEGYISTCSSNSLKSIIDSDNTHFARDLKKAAKDMSQMQIVCLDGDNFAYINIFSSVSCINGIFRVVWNKGVVDHLNPSNRFTKINLSQMMEFKNPYAYRLYELLRSYCFDPYVMPGKKNYTTSLNFTDLRYIIGANDVRSINGDITIKKGSDFSKIVNQSNIKTMRWGDFRSRILTPALDEINNISNMNVSYIPHKEGKAHEVKTIEFEISLCNRKTKKDVDFTMAVTTEKDDFYSFIKTLPELNLISQADSDSIYAACNGDKDTLLKSIECLNSTGTVNNTVAWLISCLKNKYYENKPICHSANSRRVHNRGERKYSSEEMTEITKILITQG